MSKLEKKLKEWMNFGLINEDQARRIQAYEAEKPQTSWVLYGFLILGTVIIGIGIISLIAANWQRIPAPIKLANNFLLLIGLAIATLRSWESKKKIQFEVLLLLFLILCLASIGLISQIYHTSGYLHQALMFWSLITCLAGIAAQRIFVPFLWTGAFLFGLACTMVYSPVLGFIFFNDFWAVVTAIPLLCSTLTFVSEWFAGEVGATQAFRAWILITGLFSIVTLDVISAGPSSSESFRHNGYTFLLVYSLAVLAAIGIMRKRSYTHLQKRLLLMTLSLFLVSSHLAALNIKSKIATATLIILILGLMSIFMASLKNRRLFQLFLFFWGLRFLGLYFQALGGLATTGIGLIISGGIVIGMALLWNKYRMKLASWAERLGQ